MNATGSGWLGYSLDGARRRVRFDCLGDRVLLLGRRAGDLATLVAYACAEAGARPIILDIDGSVSPEVGGYFETYDYRSMLYEAFHVEGDDAVHGQLVSAAYAAALDLTPEEESMLSAALQTVSDQNDLATPPTLYDVLGGVEGFRGFYVDKLKGRIGSLRHLDATRVESFEQLVRGGTLVDFSSAPYPQASELTAGLYVAKLLYLLGSGDRDMGPLMLTGAHRLFRDLSRFQHSGRLLAGLLDARFPLALSSTLPALLSDRLVGSMPVRVYSSEAWNSHKDWRQAAALPNSFTVCDDRSGVSLGFVPRFIRPRRRTAVLTSAPAPASPALTRTILEEVSRSEAANRQSIVSYLSPQFLSADVGAELDRLHSQGHLILEPKQVGSGPKIFGYTVSESGRRLLERVS